MIFSTRNHFSFQWDCFLNGQGLSSTQQHNESYISVWHTCKGANSLVYLSWIPPWNTKNQSGLQDFLFLKQTRLKSIPFMYVIDLISRRLRWRCKLIWWDEIISEIGLFSFMHLHFYKIHIRKKISTVKSRAVDQSTIQFFTNFGVLLTETCY